MHALVSWTQSLVDHTAAFLNDSRRAATIRWPCCSPRTYKFEPRFTRPAIHKSL